MVATDGCYTTDTELDQALQTLLEAAPATELVNFAEGYGRIDVASAALAGRIVRLLHLGGLQLTGVDYELDQEAIWAYRRGLPGRPERRVVLALRPPAERRAAEMAALAWGAFRVASWVRAGSGPAAAPDLSSIVGLHDSLEQLVAALQQSPFYENWDVCHVLRVPVAPRDSD